MSNAVKKTRRKQPERFQQISFDFYLTDEGRDAIEEGTSEVEPSYRNRKLDNFLKFGSNCNRLAIIAEFLKKKPLQKLADFLKETFHGGFGIRDKEDDISAWYAEDGIHMAFGNAARYVKEAEVVDWTNAASRVTELLSDGNFATQEEINNAPDYATRVIAERLWYLYHDISDVGKEKNILSSLSGFEGVFPKATEKLAKELESVNFRSELKEDYSEFLNQYRLNKDIMRFHYHKVYQILDNIQDLDLPHEEYQSTINDEPAIQTFITEDEINSDLTSGSGVSGGHERIYAFFMETEDIQERAEYLKKEYGTGGHSHALSRSNHSWQEHDSKGIIYRKKGCPDIHLTWTETAKRIGELIDEGRYIQKDEILLIKAKKLINDFCMDEYMEKADFKDLSQVGIAYTTLTDEEIPVQAYVDLKNYKLEIYVANELQEQREYTDLENFIENELEDLDFFDLTYFDEEVLSKYLIPDEKPEELTNSTETGNPYINSEDVISCIETVQDMEDEELSWETANKSENIPEVESEYKVEAHNFHIVNENLGEGSQREKFSRNVEAIRTLYQLETENRNATYDEQEILSQYVGWGGLADAFDPNKESWTNEYKTLKELLSESEYTSARESTLTSHYTSPVIIRSMYHALENMGFKTGNILEPSMGIGNFFGVLPESMQESNLYGVEIDSISGRIAKKLYPNADITIGGFETTDSRDFYDIIIGNVPFGDFKVHDKAFDRYNFSIHNYFFAKAISQVRPGGMIAFLTSRYTMDSQNSNARKYIAEKAELLGAIRLPNNAFKKNAGTEVVADILFLQKRKEPVAIDQGWIDLTTNDDGFTMNNYFSEHPEMVLGKPEMVSTPYGKDTLSIKPFEDSELSVLLEKAIENIQGCFSPVELYEEETKGDETTFIPATKDVKNFSYTLVDGDVYFRENSIMRLANLNDRAKERVSGMIQLRQIVNDLIKYQLENHSNEDILKKQNELNEAYDEFTAQNGIINSRANELAFSNDSSYYLLCSLENVDEDGNFKSKADMFTKRTIRSVNEVSHADTPVEALAISIGEQGCVDLPYMAELLGTPGEYENIIKELQGVIFKIPGSNGIENGWQSADEYLSGNIRVKLEEAKKEAAINHDFEVNVEALEKAMPKDLEASEIDVRLGATWINAKYIKEFMIETFETPFYLQNIIDVCYSEPTATWSVQHKSHISYNDVMAKVTYGTQRADAYHILEETLNLKDVRVYDSVEIEDGKTKRVLNKKETTLAQQKQQLIKDTFRDWIWKDAARRETLVKKYNEVFNSIRPRAYDGSHIQFVGMSSDIVLREHQRNAIARILYGGNTLLAHEVGAGKTFEMVAAAMESKRLGLCSKSLFVVPNHLILQWASEFLRLYPSANLLVATKKDFETANRKKFCARIATGDYDAIIIGHSQFEKIPLSFERQKAELDREIADIENGIYELEYDRGEYFTVKQMQKTLKNLKNKLEKLTSTERKDDVVTFEQLGVDRLFVDESHFYKNLFLYTKMRNVAGLSTSEAQKSSDMFMKCRYMDEITERKGVIFATGTPVSNSMTELYTVMRYLQYDLLQEKKLIHFDSWASTFGETTTAIELAPEGTGYRARTRFAKFFNLPELMTLLKEVADIKTSDQLNLPVPEAISETVVVKPSEMQQELVKGLSERAALVHSGSVDPSEDNMLLITSDGRKIGLDQRLMNPMLPDFPGSKLNACVDNVLRIYTEGHSENLTQLIFCDFSTPKNDGSFNVYDDIKTKLISGGVPEAEIEYIHNANSEAKKKELFSKVRSGKVRILLGSTQKMGAGTNVQDKLVAVHHLDVGWRPSDMTQRNGRIIRQGNTNKTVYIYQYVTEGTFDAYLYQTLENKQKFISQIMTSKSPVRSCEDVDEQALSYAEIKALCAGNPLIKEKMDLDIEVARLKVLKSDFQSQKYRLEDKLLKYFPEQIETYKNTVAFLEHDLQVVRDNPQSEEFCGIVINDEFYSDMKEAHKEIITLCKNVKLRQVEIGAYRGFKISLIFNPFENTYEMILKGMGSHHLPISLKYDATLNRMDSTLSNIENRLKRAHNNLSDLYSQQKAAEAELTKEFPQEAELKQKSQRLAELDAELNMENSSDAITDVA